MDEVEASAATSMDANNADEMSSEATPSGDASDDAGAAEKCIDMPLDPLAQAQAEAQQYLELAQRMRADLENFRKRVARDRETDRQMILAEFMREMLTPIHDLERALKASEQDKSFDALHDGLAMTHGAIWKVLEGRKVTRIPTTGVAFDPNVHEAMLQIPSPDYPQGVVVDEIAPGYIMESICLQPAKVVVSAGAPLEAVCGEDDETATQPQVNEE